MTLLSQQKMLTFYCQHLIPAAGATVHSTAAWLVYLLDHYSAVV